MQNYFFTAAVFSFIQLNISIMKKPFTQISLSFAIGFSFLIIFFTNIAKAQITSGTFAPKVDFVTGSTPWHVTVADIDGDGKPDLVPNSASNNVSVLRNTSSSGNIVAGSFAAKVDFVSGTGPVSSAVADLDGDGKPDLAVGNNTGNSISVFRNTSTSAVIDAGSFAAKVDFATETVTRQVIIADMDGDGKKDMIVTSANVVSIFRNSSTVGTINSGSFAVKVDFTAGTQPSGVAAADVDGDSKLDIILVNYSSNTVSVYRNTSTVGTINTGSFAAKVDFTTGTNPIHLGVQDLDGDGKPDLAVVNNNSSNVSVFRNTGTAGTINSGSFAARVDFTIGLRSGGIAIKDLDGDNKPDLSVTNAFSNNFSVLRNTATTGVIDANSFAAKVDFVTGVNPFFVAAADIDGDGSTDLTVTNFTDNNVSVYRNTRVITGFGFEPLAAQLPVKLLNNPSHGYFTLQSDISVQGKLNLRVTDVYGRLIETRNNIQTTTISFGNNYSPGIYFATITVDKKRQTLKLIKQ
jgi:hypothetical protein